MPCKAGEHFWSNFFTLVESENHITPADTGQSPAGAYFSLEEQALPLFP